MENKLEKWKILSSQYLLKKTWCTLRSDHVKMSNRKEIPDYYVLEYPNWINVIAITKQKEFIFIHQYRHGIQEFSYELPAGMCDDTDLCPIDSARRELLEETGYGNGKWELFSVISANPSTHNNLCYCFLVIDVEEIDSPKLDETEELYVVKFSLEEVKELLLSDKIKQALHAAPLWKYMAINHLID